MSQRLQGLHHITVITSSAPKIFKFMTEVLGLHLIKKTVNQDDIRTYHLYFTDDTGSAGTDITFLDFHGLETARKGNNAINRIGLRLPNDQAVDWWEQRLDEFDIRHNPQTTQFGDKVLNFYDFDGQKYQFVSDEHNHGLPGGTPYRFSPIPKEYAIVGLGSALIRTQFREKILNLVLTNLMGYDEIMTAGNLHLYESYDKGGHGAQVIAEDDMDGAMEVQGYGSVHHLAFTVEDEEALRFWIELIDKIGLPNSGFVDRFYFKSEYFQPATGILFEIATNGPGFLQDETYEEAGVHLELPPFLEEQRSDIEANLVAFNTPNTIDDDSNE